MRGKAVVLEEFGRPLALREYEVPPAPVGGMLVACRHGGICGTDLHLQQGHLPIPTPLVLGHEGLGTVHEARSGRPRARCHGNRTANRRHRDVGVLDRLRFLRPVPAAP